MYDVHISVLCNCFEYYLQIFGALNPKLVTALFSKMSYATHPELMITAFKE